MSDSNPRLGPGRPSTGGPDDRQPALLEPPGGRASGSGGTHLVPGAGLERAAELADTVASAGATGGDAGRTIGRRAGRTTQTVFEGTSLLAQPLAEREVKLAELIGRGGMGEVRRGFQPTLRRAVAVKRVHGHHDERAVANLLREAWVAGHLDHPNILPVHELGGEPDNPLLVMKLIEGVSWTDALRDPGLATGGELPDDPLAWHLDVLLELCQAVRYAHDRGVAHLDLKPDNVMLGRYGEVYLLDWGLAVAWEDAAPSWLPRPADDGGVAGTPAYMAPEQAREEPERVGPATDVYQLGAILYELITGQRLRHAKSPMAAMLMASRGLMPPLDEARLPRGLVAIVRRALQPDPGDRYADAGAFAAAVRAYRRHREADRLIEQAERRLEGLEAGGPSDEVAVQRQVTECAFAFEQALRTWPGSAAAQAGQRRLRVWQIERALDSDRLEAAEEHLAALADPPDALAARVEAARAARAAAQAEAEALRSVYDAETGRAVRVRWLWGIAALWIGWNVACGYIERAVRPFDYPALFAMSGSTFALYLVARRVAVLHLADTAFNRRATDVIGVGLGVILFHWTGGALLGLAPLRALAISTVLYVLFAALLAVLIDRRFWLMAAAQVPLVVLASLWPAYAFEWTGLAGAICAATGAIVWRQRRSVEPRPRP